MARDYNKHKNQWIKWLLSRNKKIHCKYYRFADDTLILTNTKEEQEYIWDKIMKFIESEMDLEANLAKSKRRRNKTDFLGFHFIKSEKIWIKIKEEKEIIKTAKAKIGKGSPNDIIGLRKYLIGILNYFDIVNDMTKVLGKITYRLYYLASKELIGKVEGDQGVYFKTRNCKINLWELRKKTKLSYKEYIISGKWLSEREKIIIDPARGKEWTQYKWYLFTTQRGRDIITGENLKAEDCQIHHIIPRSKGGNNELENLILISTETHKRLHYGGELPKKAEKYRKHLS